MVSNLFDQEWRETDELIQTFEDAWIAGTAPEINDFLPTPTHRQFDEILLELVRVDLEFRWQHGEAKALDDYRLEFPPNVVRRSWSQLEPGGV